jgi:hypothetical protein
VLHGAEGVDAMTAIPNKRRRPFSVIQKSEHDKALALGSTGLLVYVALCRLQSDARPDEKDCFAAGAARIAKHCGLSKRCVKSYLPLLSEEGIIEIESGRKTGAGNSNEENRITLLGSAASSPRRESETGVSCPVYVVKKEKRKRQRVDRFVPEQFPLPHGEQFDAAWQEFCTHRRELGHKLRPTATKRILKELEAVSESAAVESLHKAIAKGWRAPFPKPDKQQPQRQRQEVRSCL